MKPGGVVSLKKINSISFFKKNKLFLLMFIALIIGISIGSISVANGSKSMSLCYSAFNFYLNSRQNSGFISVFFPTFLRYTLVCFTYFLIGTSIIGVALSPVLCCALGIYFSGIAAYSYSEFALKGVAFNAIILVPSALLLVTCAFFAAKEAFSFSAVLVRLSLPKSRATNISGEFKSYCGKFLVAILLCLVAALIDSAVSLSFLKFFSF